MSVVVVFDLDGTLVDSAAAIRDIANIQMTELGLAPLDLAEAQDQRLLVFGNDRQRLGQDDENGDEADEQPHRMAGDRFEHHWPPFAASDAASDAARARRWTSLSGR